MATLVFVYGTLRRGQPNAHVLREIGATLLDTARTTARHTLEVLPESCLSDDRQIVIYDEVLFRDVCGCANFIHFRNICILFS